MGVGKLRCEAIRSGELTVVTVFAATRGQRGEQCTICSPKLLICSNKNNNNREVEVAMICLTLWWLRRDIRQFRTGIFTTGYDDRLKHTPRLLSQYKSPPCCDDSLHEALERLYMVSIFPSTFKNPKPSCFRHLPLYIQLLLQKYLNRVPCLSTK